MSPLPAEIIEGVSREAYTGGPETSVGNAVVTVISPADPTPAQNLRLIEQSGVLDFWDDPAEDMYSDNDGEPV